MGAPKGHPSLHIGNRLACFKFPLPSIVKLEKDEKVSIVREDDIGASLEDEEAAAVQEQVMQIKAQEEEFETFNLKIVHRKNRHVLNISCLLFSFICKVVEEISTSDFFL